MVLVPGTAARLRRLINIGLELVLLSRLGLAGAGLASSVAYTAMFYPPPELPVPGWPAQGSDGNWPLRASIVPAPAPPR